MVPSFIVKSLQKFQMIAEIVAKNLMKWSFFKSFINQLGGFPKKNEVGKIDGFLKKTEVGKIDQFPKKLR